MHDFPGDGVMAVAGSQGLFYGRLGSGYVLYLSLYTPCGNWKCL